jgi:hypothetical protein
MHFNYKFEIIKTIKRFINSIVKQNSKRLKYDKNYGSKIFTTSKRCDYL